MGRAHLIKIHVSLGKLYFHAKLLVERYIYTFLLLKYQMKLFIYCINF
jgi:hypothetical protein